MSILTYEQMKAIIDGGGSVSLHGRLISEVKHLPTQAELAVGNPAAEKAALSDLQAQLAELQAQIALLQPKAKRKAADDKPDGDQQPEPPKE